MNNIVYGGSLMLFVGAAKTPVAFSTSAKLAINLATKDGTTKDSGIFSEKFAGHLDWNMSTDGLLNYALTTDDTLVNSIDEFFTTMIARAPIQVAFGITSAGTSPDWTAPATPQKCFYGNAFITSLDQNAELDAATYSIKLEGTGALNWAVLS